MSRVRHAGTDAELIARDIVRSYGFRARYDLRGLPGTPDIGSISGKWAIFVHGCFWHGHRGCHRWRIPKANRSFWSRKFKQNRKRDRNKSARLRRLGFDVLTVWECELRDGPLAARKILRFLERVRVRRARERQPSNGSGVTERFRFVTNGTQVARTIIVNGVKVTESRRRLDHRSMRIADARSAFEYAFLRRRVERNGVNATATIRVADLFCGCGGLSLGAHQACRALRMQMLPRLAIDSDKDSLQVYESNFGVRHAIHEDICTVVDGRLGSPATRAERLLLRKIGRIDLMLAGPPCQGHSNLNNHTRRTDPRNELYQRVARFVELTLPRHVLIENVPSVAQSLESSLYETIKLLQSRHYHVSTAVVDLASLGVPQRRRRHVLVASRVAPVDLGEVLQTFEVKKPRNLWWAISGIAAPVESGLFDSPARLSSKNARRVAYLFKHRIFDLPDRLRPRCHRDFSHSYRSMYGRMRFNEPAQTITSGFGSPGQGRFVHPVRRTTLTPREAARVQYFPDFFDFSSAGRRTALCSMIGNAVPMRLAYVILLVCFGQLVSSAR